MTEEIKALQKIMDEKENEISQLKKQNEQMKATIQKLESNSKADQKKIRMLTKNNAKKRKLLNSPGVVDGWNEYSLCEGEDDEAQKRWEELEACWASSEESSDESDDK